MGYSASSGIVSERDSCQPLEGDDTPSTFNTDSDHISITMPPEDVDDEQPIVRQRNITHNFATSLS